MTDSGALLATCAGSGATLVAIVAGFTLTKHLAIASEIDAANNLVHDLSTRLELALPVLERARIEHDRRDFAWDLDDEDVIHELLEAAEDPSRRGLTFDELDGLVDGVSQYVREAVDQELSEWNAEAEATVGHAAFAAMQIEPRHPSWNMFRDDHDLPITREPIWAAFYKRMRKRKTGTPPAKKSGNPALDIVANMAAAQLAASQDFTFLTEPSVGRVYGNYKDSMASRVRRLEAAQSEVDECRAEIAVAKARAARIVQPQGVVGGLVCLVIVFIMTVVPSMLFLAPEPVDNLTRAKAAWLLASYFGGVAVMFAYFLRNALKLRAD